MRVRHCNRTGTNYHPPKWKPSLEVTPSRTRRARNPSVVAYPPLLVAYRRPVGRTWTDVALGRHDSVRRECSLPTTKARRHCSEAGRTALPGAHGSALHTPSRIPPSFSPQFLPTLSGSLIPSLPRSARPACCHPGLQLVSGWCT